MDDDDRVSDELVADASLLHALIDHVPHVDTEIKELDELLAGSIFYTPQSLLRQVNSTIESREIPTPQSVNDLVVSPLPLDDASPVEMNGVVSDLKADPKDFSGEKIPNFVSFFVSLIVGIENSDWLIDLTDLSMSRLIDRLIDWSIDWLTTNTEKYFSFCWFFPAILPIELSNLSREKVTFDDELQFSDEEIFKADEDNDSISSSSSSESGEKEGEESVGDDGTGGMDQYRLQRLKIIFEESDTDDEPGLDINEFKQAMKKILGEDVPEREIELIFMKVDANCDGNVDWAEFLEFTLREFQERDAMTQLTKDAFFEKSPQTVHGTRSQREIKAVVFVRQQGFGKAALDMANGRYYSLNA